MGLTTSFLLSKETFFAFFRAWLEGKKQKVSPTRSAMLICPITCVVDGRWHQSWPFASLRTGQHSRRLRTYSRHMATLHLVRTMANVSNLISRFLQLAFFALVAPSHQISATMPLKSPTWAPLHVPSLILTLLTLVCSFFLSEPFLTIITAHECCRGLRDKNLRGMRIALLGPRIRRTLYKAEKKKVGFDCLQSHRLYDWEIVT